MDTREDQVSGGGDQREEYNAPQLALLGKVEDLTHGGNNGIATDVASTSV